MRHAKTLAIAIVAAIALAGAADAKQKKPQESAPPPASQWGFPECQAAWTQLSGPSEMADLRSALLKKFDERCVPTTKNECLAFREASESPVTPEDLRILLLRKFERGC
jgi:hypothetical protein